MPTPEELKYFTALRGVIAEKMGEKEGDDRVYCAADNSSQEWVDCCEYCGECRGDIRLPLPIDPENPERGLVGMIKGFDTLMFDYDDMEWFCYTLDGENTAADTPTLALLKALAWQEGIEVPR